MKLSVNLNKIALLRNSRGSNSPCLEDFANEVIALGVGGITLHPRPDHRHATCDDALLISSLCKSQGIEFNLEGNPFSLPNRDFIGFYELCKESKPEQITLVPDSLNQLTSDHGWEVNYKNLELREFLSNINELESRTSLFINPNLESVEYAAEVGVHRIEIYTGPFAHAFLSSDQIALNKIKENISQVIERAHELNMGVNAGHDLDLHNLHELNQCGAVDEVSIGHAIVTDTLKYGFVDTIMRYINIIQES